ncbi:hypothetical protein [Bacillus aquiflavi]|uniref:hypothetical protein n=1 Tax=Bacillus aquiflavi TaxID=2672567 RepID=UPI00223C18EB|nr:hypothetical protein [Bacillus aquiflavi]
MKKTLGFIQRLITQIEKTLEINKLETITTELNVMFNILVVEDVVNTQMLMYAVLNQ